MGLGNWLKKKMAALAFATASVEKAALGQDGGADLGNGAQSHRRHRQGSLADDLKQGQLTQQVQELRWRTYKVMEEAQNYKTKIVGYETDGTPIMEVTKLEYNESATAKLAKIKIDESDDYPLELVVNNDEITLSVAEAMFGLDEAETVEKGIDEDGNHTATIGEVEGEMNESNNRVERVINCTRDLRAKFEIEKFAKKMNVRTISDTEKLLEFYVSVYPDEYNRKSRFFISEIKKAMKNPRMCDFLDLATVEFVSYNTLGVKDLHEFEYKIIKFDKIVEFDGYYLIKFKAEVVVDGESMYEKYKEGAEELIEKYDKNAPKKNMFNK